MHLCASRANILGLVAGIGISFPSMAVPAQESSWLKQREVAFARWQNAHPAIADQLDSLKTKSAALVEQQRAKEQTDAQARHAALLARSRALTSAQKEQIDALIQKAAATAKNGDCAGAETPFRKVIDLDPANGDAYYGLGHCLQQQGNLAEAAEYLTRATRFPDSSRDTNTYYTKAMMELQPLPSPRDPNINDQPVILKVSAAPTEIWDAPYAPHMTIIPAGEFTMGSQAADQYREESETPHRVTIGYPLAVSTYDVTRGEFGTFVADTRYDAKGDGCEVPAHFPGTELQKDPKGYWESPGFAQSDDDPVVCMNYNDGVAYAAWLTRKTGHTYRLASEAEFEYATRAGTTTVYYWGNDIGTGHATCDGCNGPVGPGKPTRGGTFPPNAFGLYDMSGNVWKWIEDCWNNTYDGAPTDGSAWESGNCLLRGKRSGSWFNVGQARPGDRRPPTRLRSAARFGSIPELRVSSFGLRVVRVID
jgi:formylglycine-generating enzyme required for sulfatase activity